MTAQRHDDISAIVSQTNGKLAALVRRAAQDHKLPADTAVNITVSSIFEDQFKQNLRDALHMLLPQAT